MWDLERIMKKHHIDEEKGRSKHKKKKKKEDESELSDVKRLGTTTALAVSG
jgi:hypothetical protein